MPDLLFTLPAKLIFGIDVINRLGSIVSAMGERVMLITEAILYEKKTIERVLELLEKKGIDYILYDEVITNATSSVVEEALLLARGSHAQVIIGMGGIRTLSIAKAVAMAVKSQIDFDDFMSGVQPQNEALAYLEIPTTCRNPFMLRDEYLVVDARDRTGKIGKTQQDITKCILIDPKLSVSLPPKYTATTIMDTFLNALEGYISNKSNFLSDILFENAIKLLIDNLNEIVENPEDLKQRMHASMAGVLSAIGLSMSKQGIGAALAYTINARFLVPKSWISTILLPHILEFNINAAAEKIARIAEILGKNTEGLTSVEAAKSAVEAIRRLIGSLKLPMRLRDFDLKLDEMIEISSVARSYDMMNYLPRMASAEELYDIIKTAY